MPRSLYGRLVLLLATGFTVALILSTLIHSDHREDTARRVLSWQAAQRAIDMVEILRTLPRAQRALVLGALNDQRFRPRLADRLPRRPALAGPTAAILRRVIDKRLGSESQWRVLSGPSRTVWLAAPVGSQWLILRIHFWHPKPAWPGRFLLDLLVLTAALAAASWFAVRSITRPLARLATAATALGEDLYQDALPESGPSEVRAAAEAFNAMQDRLLRHFEARARMVAAMSHDLRTPLTRMRLRTEMLDESDLRARFESDLIEMEGIVNDTLGMMRSLHNTEVPAEFDVVTLLDQLVRDRLECGQQVHWSSPGAPIPIRGKREALKRCVENLVENAVKYAGSAELRLERSGMSLRIVVLDEGPGIPEESLEQVFEPFYRVESSRSRGTGGTGLGLCIARDLAQTFGGRVRLANRVPRGLEATLTLHL
ncbi:MAG TPA: ATP-binding protein [Acidiferrobacteraceae bacterium]|nr:ATP-binding protein [Acidiferrobacteraceae bacterium]